MTNTDPVTTLRKRTLRVKASSLGIQSNVNPTNRHYEALMQMSDEDLMSQFQMGTVEAFDILLHIPVSR